MPVTGESLSLVVRGGGWAEVAYGGRYTRGD